MMMNMLQGQRQKGCTSGRRGQRGFTLIELMVVVIIIMVLIAIAVPLYNGVRKQARETAHDANVRNLEQAATMYVMDGGSEAIWAPLAGEKAGAVVSGSHEAWYRYLESWPSDPTRESVDGSYMVEITADGAVRVSPGAGEYGW